MVTLALLSTVLLQLSDLARMASSLPIEVTDFSNPTALQATSEQWSAVREKAVREKNTQWIIVASWKQSIFEIAAGKIESGQRRLETLLRDNPKSEFSQFVRMDLARHYMAVTQLAEARRHFSVLLSEDQRRLLKPDSLRRAELGAAMCDVELQPITPVTVANLRKLLEQFRAEIRARAPLAKSRDEQAQLSNLYIDWIECALCLFEALRRTQSNIEAIELSKQTLAEVESLQSKSLQPKLLFPQARLYRLLAITYNTATRFDDAAAVLATCDRFANQHREVLKKNCPTIFIELEFSRQSLLLERAQAMFAESPQAAVLPQWIDDLSRSFQTTQSMLTKDDRMTHRFESHNNQGLFETLRGNMLAVQGSTEQSRSAMQSALEHFRASESAAIHLSGQDGDHVYIARLNQARCQWRCGQLKEAASLAEQVLAGWGKHRGEDFVDLLLPLELLIELSREQDQLPKAIAYGERYHQLALKSMERYQSSLPPSDQFRFAQRNDRGVQACLRLAAACGAKGSDLGMPTYQWLVNDKVKYNEIFSQVTALAGQSASIEKFRQASQRQAFLLDVSSDGKLDERYYAEDLQKRELSAQWRTVQPRQLFEANQLKSRLAADESFIDIARVNSVNRDRDEYMAWVISRDGLQAISLGDADEIDRLVKRLHDRLQLIARGKAMEQYVGFQRAEADFVNSVLKPLSEKIYHPLVKLAGEDRRWIVSPDGWLWMVPMAALVHPDGRYAVEHSDFRYVVSARDLLSPSIAQAADQRAVIIADPDFSQHDTSDVQRAELPALDGFAKEATAIASLLPGSQLLTKSQASKRAVLGLSRAPSILYFCTHSYFNSTAAQQCSDPFLTCGLELAGANYRSPSTLSLPGTLTAAEVLCLPLRGTNLVVLSSCDSAVGVTRHGHGVMSLRHAFHCCGARNVVASLWRVDDDVALEAMTSFMSTAIESRDYAKALAASQRKLLTNPKTRHPFTWATFTLSGSN